MKDWFSIIIEQNGMENYKDFELGIATTFHKHNYTISDNMKFPWHFHIYFAFTFWFIQLQIGYDVKDLEI